MRKQNKSTKDTFRISHIIKAIKEINSFLKGINLESFKKDRKLVLAITKEIEIIGEAASKISEDTKEKTTHIPWNEMIAIRNRLIHGYFDIDEEVIFQTATRELDKIQKRAEES